MGNRQENAKITHSIPIGALVELDTGVRLFVVYHARDCDQTPLYSLAADDNNTIKERPSFSNRGWHSGYSESSLTVIRATLHNYRITKLGYKRRALLSHMKNISEYIAMIALHLKFDWESDYLVDKLQREANEIITLMEGKRNA